MFFQRSDAQVLGPVVGANAVQVMNDLALRQFAPEGLFHHMTVFKNVSLRAHTKVDVTALCEHAATNPAMIVGAEARRGLGGPNLNSGRSKFWFYRGWGHAEPSGNLPNIQSGQVERHGIIRRAIRVVLPTASSLDAKLPHVLRNGGLRYTKGLRDLALSFSSAVQLANCVDAVSPSHDHTWSIA